MADEISVRSVKKCVTGVTVFELKNDGDILIGNSKEIINEISNWMGQRQKSLQSR